MRHAKEKESVAHTQEEKKKQSIRMLSECPQMLDLADEDSKAARVK